MIKNLFLSFSMAFLMLAVFEMGLGGPSTLVIYLYYDFNSKTKGIVTGSEYRSGSTRSPSTFKVRYQYSVGGDVYASKYVNFYGFSSEAEVNKNKFYEGKEVDVYFDNNFPQVAVLEKTSIGKVVILQAFFVFFVAFYPLIRVIYRRYWS